MDRPLEKTFKEQQKTENENELGDWLEGINKESLEKAVQAGEIYPSLPLPEIASGKTVSDTLLVKFLEKPKKIITDKVDRGFMYVAIVEHQGAKKNLVIPDSLRFQLAKECKLHNLTNSKGELSPEGHRFIIGAHLQETKYRKDTKLYWAQYCPKNSGESQFDIMQSDIFNDTSVINRNEGISVLRKKFKDREFSIKEALVELKKVTYLNNDSKRAEYIEQMINHGILFEPSPGKLKFVDEQPTNVSKK